MNSKGQAKIPRNPVAMPLAITAFLTLGFTGLIALLEFDQLPDGILIALLLACLVLLTIYTLVSVRLGWIATIGHLGQRYHYQRQEAPVMYWSLVTLYLVIAIPAVWYLMGRLLTGGF